MPRTPITTNWNGRTKPTTVIDKGREGNVLWSTANKPWEATFFPWQYMNTGIATDWNNRVKPTTVINNPDRTAVPLWDSSQFPWESTFYPWQYEFVSQSIYNTPRKIALLELENGLNLELEDGILLEAEGGIKDNIIDTIWQ